MRKPALSPDIRSGRAGEGTGIGVGHTAGALLLALPRQLLDLLDSHFFSFLPQGGPQGSVPKAS